MGSSADGVAPGGEPAGRDMAGEADPEGREAAGVAEGFTCTSAAKRTGPASTAAAMDNNLNLNMGCYATHCGPFRKINSSPSQAKRAELGGTND